ncbi:hypothetical protein [Polaromonas sp. LjRoot131]|uniref:hypothetical protein n=1 Tax=Polaromonas sp. LjRoot131 TaxID=3342262 RepID=UPI003ECEA919
MCALVARMHHVTVAAVPADKNRPGTAKIFQRRGYSAGIEDAPGSDCWFCDTHYVRDLMALFLKVILLLFGLAFIASGVKSVLRREAKFTWHEDSDKHRIVEGLPAILVGLGEVAMGLCFLYAMRLPAAS